MSEMTGRDFYFRRVYGGKKGPVLHARGWDAERFLNAEINRGATEKKEEDRYEVLGATEAEYKQERRT